MSLIHNALKSMDGPEPSKPVVASAHAPAASAKGGHRAWLEATLAFGVVVGAGVLGWMLWQNQLQSTADLAPVAVAPLKAAVQPAPLPAEAMAPVAAADASTTSPSPVIDDVAATAAQRAQLRAVSVRLTPPATPAAAPKALAGRTRSERRAAPTRPASPRRERTVRPPVRVAAAAVSAPVTAAAPAVDNTPVELRFARFVSAMKSGQTADAERELAALKMQLPAGSIVLLRARAWFDLSAGRDAAASEMYRTIIERIPGDEEAAINLASIQARQNKTEEARATLDAAVRLQPDSVALRSALARFTPNARQ